MSNVIDVKQFPGGTVATLPLSAGPSAKSVQVGFSGRATGVVTVTARGNGADLFDPVTNGAVNLATTGTLIIEGAIAELKFSDAGTGVFTVTATSVI